MLSRPSCWSSSVLYFLGFSRDIWNRKCVFAAGANYWDVYSDQIILYFATFPVDGLPCGHPSLRPIYVAILSKLCFGWWSKRIICRSCRTIGNFKSTTQLPVQGLLLNNGKKKTKTKTKTNKNKNETRNKSKQNKTKTNKQKTHY